MSKNFNLYTRVSTMFDSKISTTIKKLVALLMFMMLSTIAITIYLNEQNYKDAMIINIAGKERMLTQKMAKNIFYLYHNQGSSLDELDASTAEFKRALSSLRDGGLGVERITREETLKLLDLIDQKWQSYYADIVEFKKTLQSGEELELLIASIYSKNLDLLSDIDAMVFEYTRYSQDKIHFIERFQYASATLLLIIFIYSLLRLRSIEAHADAFVAYSKMLAKEEDLGEIKPLDLDGEANEIHEASRAINKFITKLSRALEDSNEAIEHSQSASGKLAELTLELDEIIDAIKDQKSAAKVLNSSEDIVIASTEDLINSSKKLLNLRKELEELYKSCQNIK